MQAGHNPSMRNLVQKGGIRPDEGPLYKLEARPTREALLQTEGFSNQGSEAPTRQVLQAPESQGAQSMSTRVPPSTKSD